MYTADVNVRDGYSNHFQYVFTNKKFKWFGRVSVVWSGEHALKVQSNTPNILLLL